MTSTFIARLSIIILALAIGVAGIGAYAYAGGGAAAVADSAYARQQPTLVPTPSLAPAPAVADLDTRNSDARLQTDPFIRTELFFGSERPNKPEVSDTEFKLFLDQEVTPRFPDGLTVLKGFGQFRGVGWPDRAGKQLRANLTLPARGAARQQQQDRRDPHALQTALRPGVGAAGG